jgi:uncharacterized protein YjbI with pentapeptide repeats
MRQFHARAIVSILLTAPLLVFGASTAGAARSPAAPQVVNQPQPATQVAGKSVHFTAKASGVPKPTVQWEVSTDGGGIFTAIQGATGTKLDFVASAASNGNLYEAIFTNSTGTATSSAASLGVTESSAKRCAKVPRQGINLSGCDLTDAQDSGATFTEANLRGTDLTGAQLEAAQFTNADLAESTLVDADLEGANLAGADFTEADLNDADLVGTNVAGGLWSGTICPDGTNSDNDGGTCSNNLSIVPGTILPGTRGTLTLYGAPLADGPVTTFEEFSGDGTWTDTQGDFGTYTDVDGQFNETFTNGLGFTVAATWNGQEYVGTWAYGPATLSLG